MEKTTKLLKKGFFAMKKIFILFTTMVVMMLLVFTVSAKDITFTITDDNGDGNNCGGIRVYQLIDDCWDFYDEIDLYNGINSITLSDDIIYGFVWTGDLLAGDAAGDTLTIAIDDENVYKFTDDIYRYLKWFYTTCDHKFSGSECEICGLYCRHESISNEKCNLCGSSDTRIIIGEYCYDRSIATLYDNGDFIIDGEGFTGVYSIYGGFYKLPKHIIKNVIINEGITEIAWGAFQNCYQLESVTIPDSCIAIGGEAFWGTKLKYVYGAKNLISTCEASDYGAFSGTKIYTNSSYWDNGGFYIGNLLLNGIRTSDDGRFEIREGTIAVSGYEIFDDLKKLVVPKSLKSFSDITNIYNTLTDIYYYGTEEEWNEIPGVDWFEDRDITIHYNYHVHEYNVSVTDPTCTEFGFTTYMCVCGDSYIDNYTDKLNHKYSSEVTTNPTHLSEGVVTYTCECGDTYTESIAKLEGHTYNSEVTNDATHFSEGVITFKCACGDSYTETIPLLDCSFTVYESDDNATCLEDGTKTAYCDYGCGNTNTIADEGSALGHNMGEYIVTKEATCTTTGEERVDCSKCDYYETRDTATIPHSYNAVKTEATCTAEGYTTYTCGCGDTYTTDFINPLGHEMGEYVTVIESTCTAGGIEKADCTRCDYNETRDLPVKDHIDENLDGYCEGCGDYIADENCLCVCHAKTIGAFVYKLFKCIDKVFKTKLVSKVFGMTEICACGIRH